MLVCPHFTDEEAEVQRGRNLLKSPQGGCGGQIRTQLALPAAVQKCVSEQQEGSSRDWQTCDSLMEIHSAGPRGAPVQGSVSRGAAEVCFAGTGPTSWAALTLKGPCL